jgi:hypothetical protein
MKRDGAREEHVLWPFFSATSIEYEDIAVRPNPNTSDVTNTNSIKVKRHR